MCDEGDDAGFDEEKAEEEAEEEATLTEPEDDDDRLELVDPYLAEAMGLEAGSPPPPSAYVGTIAYEVNEDLGHPIPYEAYGATSKNLSDDAGNDGDVDLVRELAQIEHLGSCWQR